MQTFFFVNDEDGKKLEHFSWITFFPLSLIFLGKAKPAKE
jgi:hypothetical protein